MIWLLDNLRSKIKIKRSQPAAAPTFGSIIASQTGEHASGPCTPAESPAGTRSTAMAAPAILRVAVVAALLTAEFFHRHRFAGHRGLADEQIPGAEHPAIGGNHVAGREHDQIAWPCDWGIAGFFRKGSGFGNCGANKGLIASKLAATGIFSEHRFCVRRRSLWESLLAMAASQPPKDLAGSRQ